MCDIYSITLAVCFKTDSFGYYHNRPPCGIKDIISSTTLSLNINSSFFAFVSFLTLLSTASARFLLPIFFWNTGARGPLPRRYFAPLPFWCSANLRATSVVIPVYKAPSLHLIRYMYQFGIIFVISFPARPVRVERPPVSLTGKCVYVQYQS
jgi:hypothetical protein